MYLCVIVCRCKFKNSEIISNIQKYEMLVEIMIQLAIPNYVHKEGDLKN